MSLEVKHALRGSAVIFTCVRPTSSSTNSRERRLVAAFARLLDLFCRVSGSMGHKLPRADAVDFVLNPRLERRHGELYAFFHPSTVADML